MKRIIVFITLLLCLFAKSTFVFAKQADINGSIDTFHYFSCSSPNNRLVSRTRLLYQLWYPDNNKFSYTFALKAVHDDLDSKNTDIETRELFADCKLGDIDLRIGRQFIIWGKWMVFL